MARRSDHTREALKDMAIEAGRTLIKEDGLTAFSAREVAKRIGYTVGTIYNVFGDYDELILHINALTLDSLYADIEKAIAHKNDTLALRAMANAYLDFSEHHYHEWITLFEYHVSKNKKLPDWYQTKFKRFFTLLEQILLPMTGNSTHEAQRTARILWSGIHGICILAITGKLDLVQAESPRLLALSFIDTYIKGITGKRP